MSIRVVIVEDHPMVAAGMSAVLGGAGIEVLATPGSVRDGIAAIVALDPDVAVIDQRLPDGRGTDLVRQLLAEGHRSRALIVSAEPEPVLARDVLDAGALGCISKVRDTAALVSAVHAVADGRTYFAADALAYATDAGRTWVVGSDLTPRERDVLARVAAGSTNRAIAGDLGLSVNTVGNHVQSILGKLGVHTRLEAVLAAMREGLVSGPTAS